MEKFRDSQRHWQLATGSSPCPGYCRPISTRVTSSPTTPSTRPPARESAPTLPPPTTPPSSRVPLDYLICPSRWLAQTYATNHAHMANNDHPPCDGTKEDAFAQNGGITNGAKWYSVSGGMQDFNYLGTNAMEITLELSCEKMPNGELLPAYWEDNKKALLAYLFKVGVPRSRLMSSFYSGPRRSQGTGRRCRERPPRCSRRRLGP